MKDGKFVVLYVDDDPDVLDSVRMILEAHGYIFVGAVSAEDGLRQYRACAPDVVIVDLMMEEIDSGTSLVKELRLLGNAAPVFMLSSAGDQLSLVTNCDDLGLAGVFQKPIQPEKLLSTLRARLKNPGA